MDIWLDIPTPVAAVLPRRVVLPLEHPLSMGRDPDADIRVGMWNMFISQRQCEVGRDGCGAWFQDVGSRNGTFLNEGLVEVGSSHRLLPHDVMRIGNTRIRVGWDFVVEPSWLHWEAGIVVALARRVRDEGDHAAMPILADALEDVGCTESGILEHMRGPRPHVRECWVIDALLNPKRGKSVG